MPFLSFEHAADAAAFAVVEGGTDDGAVLYIHPGDARATTEAGANPYAVRLDPSGEFIPLPTPDPKARDIFYVTGASGCGKSRMAAKIAAQYGRMWPDRTIYLVSKIDDDAQLDSIPSLRRINTETLITLPIDWHELANSMIVFDDFDTFPTDILRACRQLINEVATLGRHECISMVLITHEITSGLKSRIYLSESQNFIVYPTGASAQQLRYLLESHAGVEGKLVGLMRRLGRWVMVRKQWPQALLSKTFAGLLNCDVTDGVTGDGLDAFLPFTGGGPAAAGRRR